MVTSGAKLRTPLRVVYVVWEHFYQIHPSLSPKLLAEAVMRQLPLTRLGDGMSFPPAIKSNLMAHLKKNLDKDKDKDKVSSDSICMWATRACKNQLYMRLMFRCLHLAACCSQDGVVGRSEFVLQWKSTVEKMAVIEPLSKPARACTIL